MWLVVANCLQANTVYAYTHDANGNLTGRTNKKDNSSVTYAYNLEQQLAEVVTPGHKLQYKYDPLGRRTEKSVNGSPTHYVYDNEDIIAMLDGEGKVLQTFTHGPGIDEPLILTKADGANYYYHADGLGSIVALTDDNTKIAEAYSYKAYGQPKLKNAKGEELTASAVGNPYLFTARELDSESGLYYYRARYYDWQRGAFTQEDQIGFNPGSTRLISPGDSMELPETNLYHYAQTSPTKFVDPFGLRWEYSQRTGLLWYVNDLTGKRTLIGKGFSGTEDGLNNPYKQNKRFVGPIPRGDWEVGKGYDSYRLGPLTMDLNPLSADTFERDLFRMHGGTRSEGCIIMGPAIRNRVNQSHDRKMRVIW